MNTFTKAVGITCVLASSALAFASACGSDDDDGAPVVPDGGSDATTLADGAVSAGLADGQIYQILVTFNQGEVSEASAAGPLASTDAVRNLAEQFEGDYTSIDAKLATLAQLVSLVPGSSDQAAALAARTTADLAVYAGLTGTAFDSAYLTAQITGYEALLNLIDTSLTVSVVDSGLAGLVAAERVLIASSLADAQALENDAGAADAGSDAALDADTDATVDAADASDAGDATAADADADASDADADGDAADAADASDGD